MTSGNQPPWGTWLGGVGWELILHSRPTNGHSGMGTLSRDDERYRPSRVKYTANHSSAMGHAIFHTNRMICGECCQCAMVGCVCQSHQCHERRGDDQVKVDRQACVTN